MKILAWVLCVLVFELANAQFKEYASVDEPVCTTDCSAIATNDKKRECFKEQMKYHNYKLVKSMFNYGKAAIYAGLWVNRYEKPDNTLFERVFNETLAEYNKVNLLRNIDFNTFQNISTFVYQKMKPYTSEEVKYDKYPSLKCPTPCTYELVTWQTLVGISIGIFVLALITTGIYSIYLHKQYSILSNRMKNIKYTKIIT